MRVDLSARRADPIFCGVRRLPEGAIAPTGARRERPFAPTLAFKANGALPRAIVILMFSNDAKTRIAAIDVPRWSEKVTPVLL